MTNIFEYSNISDPNIYSDASANTNDDDIADVTARAKAYAADADVGRL